MIGYYLIAHYKRWKDYISDEFYEVMNHLLERGWKLIEITDQTHVSVPDDALWVLEWETYSLEVDTKARRAIFCDDLHFSSHMRWNARMNKLQRADLIFATYANRMKSFGYPSELIERTVWLPHSASSRFHQPNLGVVDMLLPMPSPRFSAWYPYRQIIKSLNIAQPLEHPEYTGYPTIGRRALDPKDHVNDPQIMVKEFAKASCVITDSSVYGYLLAKHFEIMASGALLLTDEMGAESLEALGFQRNVHFMVYTIQTVPFTLMRSNATDVAKAGQSLTLNKHTTLHRANQICDVINITN